MPSTQPTRVPPIILKTGSLQELQQAFSQMRGAMNRALDELDATTKLNLRSSPSGLAPGAIWSDNGTIRQVGDQK